MTRGVQSLQAPGFMLPPPRDTVGGSQALRLFLAPTEKQLRDIAGVGPYAGSWTGAALPSE